MRPPPPVPKKRYFLDAMLIIRYIEKVIMKHFIIYKYKGVNGSLKVAQGSKDLPSTMTYRVKKGVFWQFI